jgi:hypothetical protein
MDDFKKLSQYITAIVVIEGTVELLRKKLASLKTFDANLTFNFLKSFIPHQADEGITAYDLEKFCEFSGVKTDLLELVRIFHIF